MPGPEMTMFGGGNQPLLCPTTTEREVILIVSDARLLSQASSQLCQASGPGSQLAANSFPASPLKMHSFCRVMSSPG